MSNTIGGLHSDMYLHWLLARCDSKRIRYKIRNILFFQLDEHFHENKIYCKIKERYIKPGTQTMKEITLNTNKHYMGNYEHHLLDHWKQPFKNSHNSRYVHTRDTSQSLMSSCIKVCPSGVADSRVWLGQQSVVHTKNNDMYRRGLAPQGDCPLHVFVSVTATDDDDY